MNPTIKKYIIFISIVFLTSCADGLPVVPIYTRFGGDSFSQELNECIFLRQGPGCIKRKMAPLISITEKTTIDGFSGYGFLCSVRGDVYVCRLSVVNRVSYNDNKSPSYFEYNNIIVITRGREILNIKQTVTGRSDGGKLLWELHKQL